MAGTTEEERALSGYCHMRVQGWLNLRVSTTPKRRGLASNRNVMGIYATMRQTRHPRIRDPARIWTWTRICVIVAPRESRILTWTWWSRRRSFCVANKLTRSALSRLHCRSCACVTVTLGACLSRSRRESSVYVASTSLWPEPPHAHASLRSIPRRPLRAGDTKRALFHSGRTIKVRGKARTASSPSVSHSKAAVIPHWSPFHPGPGNHPCVRTSE